LAEGKDGARRSSKRSRGGVIKGRLKGIGWSKAKGGAKTKTTQDAERGGG